MLNEYIFKFLFVFASYLQIKNAELFNDNWHFTCDYDSDNRGNTCNFFELNDKPSFSLDFSFVKPKANLKILNSLHVS